MKRLPKTSALGSRAFFFFSGHGLELYRDKQLLLPADYLRPPVCNVNRALSTYNLYAGLAALLLRLRQRGLPHRAEVLGWAVCQNSELLVRARLGKRRTEALGELQQQLRQASRFFRSGGLFTVFAGPSGMFGPELVLPLESNTT
jgi:hypothetical protein